MEVPGPTTVLNVLLAAKVALVRADKIGARSVALPGIVPALAVFL